MQLFKMLLLFSAIVYNTANSSFAQTSSLFYSLINKETNTPFQFGAGFVVQVIDQKIIQKNSVKDIIVWQYKNDSTQFESTKHTYDSTGRCISMFTFIIDYKVLWKYDNLNNVIEEYDSTNSKLRWHSLFAYSYDEKGNIIKRISHYLPDTCEICNYKTENKITADKCRDTCLSRSIDFTYDSQNRLIKIIEQVYWKSSHYEKLEFTYTYDIKGRLIEKTEFDNWKYYYDSKGKLKRCEKLNSLNKVVENIVFKYDKKQRLKKQLTYSDKRWGELEEYIYNENNLISTWTCTRGSKKDNFRGKLVFKRNLIYVHH